jgi:digeranylgeranylglycerophospholipid reductase
MTDYSVTVMYDIAVVGAGPSGSTAAMYLAKMGFNVCLFEKVGFPRDKPCGGAFGLDLLTNFAWLGRKSQEFLSGVCRRAVVHSPNRVHTLKSDVEMAVALRTDFDNAIYESALEHGTDAFIPHRVKRVRISNESVKISTAKGGDVESRVIIGADGVNSLVAREVGLMTKWPRGSLVPCNVAEIPARGSQLLDFYGVEKEYHFFTDVGGHPGYGWIFPKSETVNVGLGEIDTHSAGLPRRFRAFIRMLQRDGFLMEDADLSRTRGGLVPVRGPIPKTYANRCLLVGDSAGMVNPLTGGGIALAMRAARMAARVLESSLGEDTLSEISLSSYQNLWTRDFGSNMRTLLLAQRVATSSMLDVLFEIASRDKLISEKVGQSFSEASDVSFDVSWLALRTALVCFKSAFHIN